MESTASARQVISKGAPSKSTEKKIGKSKQISRHLTYAVWSQISLSRVRGFL